MDVVKIKCEIKESEEWIALMEKNFNNFAMKEQREVREDIEMERQKVNRLKSTLAEVI